MSTEDFDFGAAVDSVAGELKDIDSSESPEVLVASDKTSSEAAEPGSTETAAVTTKPAPSLTSDNAPKTWKPEVQALWANLDPTVKQEILRREEDMFRGLEQYKANSDSGKFLTQIAQPYEQAFAKHNLPVRETIAPLLQAQYILLEGSADQKKQLVTQLCQDFGIDLSGANFEAPAQASPEVAALQNEIKALKSSMSGFTVQQQQRVKAESAAELEKFEKDPANIYFNELLPDMAQLLEANAAGTLKEAYELAMWKNPAVRSKEVQRQASEHQTAAQKAAAEKAAASAKASSASVKTSAKSGGAAAASGSIEDTLKDSLALIRKRA